MRSVAVPNIQVFKIGEEGTSFEQEIGMIFVPPVWGNNLSAGDYYGHIVGTFNNDLDLLTPAEVGCALSHLSIYRTVEKSGRKALVVESDIELNSANLEKVYEVLRENPDADFIHLTKYEEFEFSFRRQDGFSTHFVNPHSHFWGTAAYIISPRCARELRQFHEDYIRRADDWSKFFRISQIEALYSPIFFHPAGHSGADKQREMREVFSSIDLLSFSVKRTISSIYRKIKYSKYFFRA